MAGADRMTIEEVVKQVLLDEQADVLRAAVEAVCGELMEIEVSQQIGAERGERRPDDRMTHRNEYRAREWQTRAGTVELQIPKLRRGSYFPSFLEPRRRSEQALLSVVQQAYVCGVSTRRVDQLVESLGLRISKSEVSRICQALDEHVDAFRTRPLEGAYPYLVLDTKVEKVRDGGPGRQQGAGDRPRRARDRPARDPLHRRRRGRDRGVLNRLPQAPGQARPGRRPARDLRRARGVEGRDRQGAGLQLAALHHALPARLLGHARKDQHGLLAALIRPIFNADSLAQARDRLSEPVAHLDDRLGKIATLLEDAETDILAFYAFPSSHWRKLRSTNPLERSNKEIGRRTDVVGILPDDRSLIRLAGMLCIEQNDEWLVERACLSAESIALVLAGPDDHTNKENKEEVPELQAA